MFDLTRRDLIQKSAIAGTAMLLPWRKPLAAGQAVLRVLSTTDVTPAVRASLHSAAMSTMPSLGFVGDSKKRRSAGFCRASSLPTYLQRL